MYHKNKTNKVFDISCVTNSYDVFTTTPYCL